VRERQLDKLCERYPSDVVVVLVVVFLLRRRRPLAPLAPIDSQHIQSDEWRGGAINSNQTLAQARLHRSAGRSRKSCALIICRRRPIRICLTGPGPRRRVGTNQHRRRLAGARAIRRPALPADLSDGDLYLRSRPSWPAPHIVCVNRRVIRPSVCVSNTATVSGALALWAHLEPNQIKLSSVSTYHHYDNSRWPAAAAAVLRERHTTVNGSYSPPGA
jgi:hypothetical protein